MGPGPRTQRSTPFSQRISFRVLLAAAVWFAVAGAFACRGSSPEPTASTDPPTDEVTESQETERDEPTESAGAPDDQNASAESESLPRKPHRLGSFFRALTEAKNPDVDRRVRVLHVGDSHTASDTMTGHLRTLFQDGFGSAGRGYAYPGVPWRTFRQEQMDYDMSEHWRSELGIHDDARPPFALGGLRVESSDGEAWLERSSCGLDDEEDESSSDEDAEKGDEECPYGKQFDRVAIFYLKQPDGGSFVVTVDGEEPTIVDTAADEPKLGIYRRGLDLARHRVRIEPEGDGMVSLFGIRTGAHDDGIEYSSLGLNGAKATQFVSFDRELTERTVTALNPDLIVVAFGTNTAFDLYRMYEDSDVSLERVTQRLASYQFEFDRLLARYTAAAPEASCLVMLPPDAAPQRENEVCRKRITVRGTEVCIPSTIRNFEGVVAAQRATARRHECAVWNQSKAMGGEGSIRRWATLRPPLAQSDGVHLTMDGYRMLAKAFFDDLMRTYERWIDGGDARLRTRTIDVSRGLRTRTPHDGQSR